MRLPRVHGRSVHQVLLQCGRRSRRLLLLCRGGGCDLCSPGAAVLLRRWTDLGVVDLALLQELLRVQRVERAQVVHHGHQLREDGGMFRVLRQEDAAEHVLQLVLHLLHQVGVAQSGTI